MRSVLRDLFPGLIGGLIGGVVGYAIFVWAIGQGLYAMIVPGAMVGLGASLLSSTPSKLRGAITGIGGLGLSLYAEWVNFPWQKDSGLSYFLANMGSLRGMTLLMIAVGTLVAWRWGGQAMKPGMRDGNPAA